MGSIGDMAYLASGSDVLMASRAIFHLSDHITRLDGLCERLATPRDYARHSPWVGHFRPAIPDFAIARPQGRSRRARQASLPVLGFASFAKDEISFRIAVPIVYP